MIAPASIAFRQMAVTFGKTRPTVLLSFGGGQDSTLLLYLTENEDFRDRFIGHADLLVAGSDTGDEHPETYAYIEDHVRPYCARRGIDFVWITPDMGFHTAAWQSLGHQYEKNSCCGFKEGANGSCSDSLKIQVVWRYVNTWLAARYGFPASRKQAISNYAATFGRLRCMIGFGAGEERRISTRPTGQRWFDTNVLKSYPLVELKLDRLACQHMIRALGHLIPPPSHCVMCHWKSKLEIMWTRRHLPDRFARWVAIEQAKLAKFAHLGPAKNKTVFGGGLTLTEVADLAEVEYAEWSSERIEEYRMSHGHCVASTY